MAISASAPHLHVEPGDAFSNLIREIASGCGVPQRPLALQALLHLPRLASSDGTVNHETAHAEVTRLADDLRAKVAPFESWLKAPTPAPRSPRELRLSVDPQTARIVLERFHYLRSFRRASGHFVSFAAEQSPAAVLSVSPFDLPTLVDALPSGVSDSEVRVLSRVFAFDWVPRNTLTRLMRELSSQLRRQGDRARILLTYVNPNLGFDAASYRAGNWTLLARETGTRYAYLDGAYVTDRELARRFGTSSPGALTGALGHRFEVSRMPLLPLDLYAYPVDARLRPQLERTYPIEVPRPTP